MDIEKIAQQACDNIDRAVNLAELEQARVEVLGKKGTLTELLKDLKKLDAKERPIMGQKVNAAKIKIAQHLQAKREQLEAAAVLQSLQKDAIDITLPGRNIAHGSRHPVSLTIQEMSRIFMRLGFSLAEGPEIESDYYNFTALNTPSDHPARNSHDTFYFSEHLLLRSHTSSVQIRNMEQNQPPFKMIAAGKVYRRDSDLTHTPMFHQLEGLVVDRDISLVELKGTLYFFLKEFFKRDIKMRFRSSYFPFTEPSFEVDIACIKCEGAGCRICSDSGWLEVLGCGMVHPKVLQGVKIDSQSYSGFAFGLGVERFAMLKYGIADLRLNFENNLDFLEQF